MGTWRAQVRLPGALDRKIRKFAVDQKMKLKDAVQAMIDDGVAEIRASADDHKFCYAELIAASDADKFEYVIDDRYRNEIDSVTAFVLGQGKRGKALTETIGVGARKRKLL